MNSYCILWSVVAFSWGYLLFLVEIKEILLYEGVKRKVHTLAFTNQYGGQAMAQTVHSVSSSQTQAENIDRFFTCYQAVKEAKVNARDTLLIVRSLSNDMKNLCTILDDLDNLVETIIFCENCENKEKSYPQAEPFD